MQENEEKFIGNLNNRVYFCPICPKSAERTRVRGK